MCDWAVLMFSCHLHLGWRFYVCCKDDRLFFWFNLSLIWKIWFQHRMWTVNVFNTRLWRWVLCIASNMPNQNNKNEQTIEREREVEREWWKKNIREINGVKWKEFVKSATKKLGSHSLVHYHQMIYAVEYILNRDYWKQKQYKRINTEQWPTEEST